MPIMFNIQHSHTPGLIHLFKRSFHHGRTKLRTIFTDFLHVLVTASEVLVLAASVLVRLHGNSCSNCHETFRIACHRLTDRIFWAKLDQNSSTAIKKCCNAMNVAKCCWVTLPSETGAVTPDTAACYAHYLLISRSSRDIIYHLDLVLSAFQPMDMKLSVHKSQ